MRIAVTGRGGQLANAMLERTANQPQVTLLAFVRAAFDLTKPEAMLPELRKVRPDIIVNAAAYTAVDKAESEPDLAMAVNGAGAGAVAEAARALGVPIVQISTDYVFDGSKARPTSRRTRPDRSTPTAARSSPASRPSPPPIPIMRSCGPRGSMRRRARTSCARCWRWRRHVPS